MKAKRILMSALVLAAGVVAAQPDEKPRTPHVVISENAAQQLLVIKVGPVYPGGCKSQAHYRSSYCLDGDR